MRALHDAAGVGDITARPERFTVVVLGCGPFLFGLGDSAEVGDDRAVDHAVGFGHILQEFQGITKSGLGGLDVAAEVAARRYQPDQRRTNGWPAVSLGGADRCAWTPVGLQP